MISFKETLVYKDQVQALLESFNLLCSEVR